MKQTPSPGKFQRSGNIGSKSAELVEGSASFVPLTHSEGKHGSLHLKGSKLQKAKKKNKIHTTGLPRIQKQFHKQFAAQITVLPSQIC